jgi:hypothetical protein
VLQPDLPVDILHGRTHLRSLVIAFCSLDSLSVVPLLVTLSLSPLVSLPHFPSSCPHRSDFGLTSPVVPPTVEGHRRICSTLGLKGDDRVSRLSIKPTRFRTHFVCHPPAASITVHRPRSVIDYNPTVILLLVHVSHSTAVSQGFPHPFLDSLDTLPARLHPSFLMEGSAPLKSSDHHSPSLNE